MRSASTAKLHRLAAGHAVVAALVVAAGMAAPALAVAEETSRVDAPHVGVELVARESTIAPGRALYAGIRFALEDGWHVYWRNPGDSGLAPRLRWSLPPDLSAGDVEWPTPERIRLGPLVDYGYSGDVLLPVAISPAEELPVDRSARLAVHVEWLVCREDCIPGDADLALDLPVRSGTPTADPRHEAAFASALARLPRAAPPGAIEVRAQDHALAIEFPLAVSDALAPDAVAFFPATPGLIDNAAPQELAVSDGRARLVVARSPQPHVLPARLTGVLASRVGFASGERARALEIDAPIGGAAAGGSRAAERLAASSDDVGGLAAALALAFLGGVVLNLMPCVFPVLSLKILDFARQSSGEPRIVRRHGIAYAAGIVLSFWVLAGLLLTLRAGGEEIGWGFQLQSPPFVAALALLAFGLALSLLGVYDLGVGLTGVAGRFAGGQGIGGSFATGALATVLATPCTAPFMGAALGYALTLAAPAALAVFTALAIGMAAPYLLLCFVPGAMTWLPRPGAWMETLKQALAFPLLATVVWLVWVRAEQGPPIAVLGLLSAILLLGMALWLVGSGAQAASSGGGLRRVAAAAIAALAIATALRSPAATGSGTTASGSPSDPLADSWQTFSNDRLTALRNAGTPVFIDFTAAWCLTCQVNEQLVFRTEAVRRGFEERGVALLRADWTRRDGEITRALESFGRSGVPLYVLYPAASAARPEVLPAVLTPGVVLRALERLPRLADDGGARPRAAG